VRDEILSSLVSIWKLKGLKVLDKRVLETRYDRLINAADYLGQDPRIKRGDQVSLVWIETKKKEYDTLFDIAEASSATSSAPNTPMKRKVDDLVS